MNPTDDRELVMQTYSQTANEAIYWNEMANGLNREISKQLLGAAVIAIPLTGTIVTGINDLNYNFGIALAIGMACILLSIFAGIQDMTSGSEFFNTYARHNANRAGAIFANHNFALDDALRAADVASPTSDLAAKSNETWSIIQNYFLGTGLFAVSAVIIASVFMPH